MSSEDDTERTSVKTYVPAYQKETWVEHAEALGMTQSEFVRTMVQAGRRGFSVDREDGASSDSNPGGDGVEERVLEVLSTGGARDWDELLDAVSDDVETRLEDALDELQESNRIRYSGRDGGYVIGDE